MEKQTFPRHDETLVHLSTISIQPQDDHASPDFYPHRSGWVFFLFNFAEMESLRYSSVSDFSSLTLFL